MDDMILACSFAVSFPDVFDVDLQGLFIVFVLLPPVKPSGDGSSS